MSSPADGTKRDAMSGRKSPARGLEILDDKDDLPLPIGMEHNMLDKWQPPDGFDDNAAARPQVTGLEMIEDDAGPDLHWDIPRKDIVSPWTNQNEVASNTNNEDSSSFAIPTTSAEMGIGHMSGTIKLHANENVDEENPQINDDARTRNSPLDRSHDATVQAIVHATNSPEGEMHFVPEAVLVENADVVIGTPLEPQLPWMKQRRTRALLAVICVGMIGLMVSRLSSDKNEPAELIIDTGIVQKIAPPSFSSSPSSSRSSNPNLFDILSFVPSPVPLSSPRERYPLSLAPSSMPTLSSSPSKSPLLPTLITSPFMAHMDTLVEADCDQCWPHVALYGDTAVVARKKIDIQFFSLKNSTVELITKIDINYSPTDVATNGNTVVIGSVKENSDVGAVHVYKKDKEGIWYKATSLGPDQVHGGAMTGGVNSISKGPLFGRSVSLYDDLLVVGADDDGDTGEGSAYIFRQDKDSIWVKQEKLTPSDMLAEGYGYAVSIKGNTAVVGDMPYGDNQEGAVFVYGYEASSNSWIKSGGTLMNNDCSSFFANSVSLTHDEELLVGCKTDNSIYYYEKQGTENEYDLQQIMEFDNIVHSMKVDENVMVVSEDRKGMSNIIHFFLRKNHVWQEVKKIDEPADDSTFGYRVALFGNVILIASAGNVYISL